MQNKARTATMNHETAKKNVESARGNMDNSCDEVKAAEVQLKEAEEILTVMMLMCCPLQLPHQSGGKSQCCPPRASIPLSRKSLLHPLLQLSSNRAMVLATSGGQPLYPMMLQPPMHPMVMTAVALRLLWLKGVDCHQ